MNKINHFISSAEQMHHIVSKFIRNGSRPVLIKQYQIPTPGELTAVVSDKPPQYEKQVINLSRKY